MATLMYREAMTLFGSVKLAAVKFLIGQHSLHPTQTVPITRVTMHGTVIAVNLRSLSHWDAFDTILTIGYYEQVG